MRVKTIFLKGAALGAALGVAFVAGIAVHTLRPAPYEFLRDLAWRPLYAWIAAPTPREEPEPVVVVAAPVHAPAAPSLHSIVPLNSVLLPLIKDTLAIPGSSGITAGQGGGITIFDDRIIIADLHGAFFKVEDRGGRIERLDLPALPNNFESYEKFIARPATATGRIFSSGFRVHDIKSKKEANGVRLFVSYERFLPKLKTTALAISAITVREADFTALGPWEDIYQGEPLHVEWYSGVAGGSRLLAIGNELYVTAGDYNQDNVFMRSKFEAQNPDNDFGKIFKIELQTKQKIPLSMGHRVPQGLAVTSKGTIYATEHGPRGGDLLTRVVPGTNFGWPLATYGTHYTTYDWPNREFDTGNIKFDKPVHVWLPSIGASNLIEADRFHPAWAHDLLVTSLVAKSLHRVRLDDDGRVIYVEPILIGERLRDIAALSDGTLVLWTDEAHLIFLTVDAAKLASNSRALSP